MVKRFDVYWINLDSTIGAETKNFGPDVVISPYEMNDSIKTVIIAPVTSTMRKYPFRVDISIKDKKGQIALDHLRSIDKNRIGKKMTSLSESESKETVSTIVEMFK